MRCCSPSVPQYNPPLLSRLQLDTAGGGVSSLGLGVGVFFVKKLVKGVIPFLLTFFNALTPLLSFDIIFFFFGSKPS